MDVTQRNHEDEENRETPAGSCQTCQVMAGISVAMATVFMMTALLLCPLWATWTAKPELDLPSEWSEHELVERLQRCQTEKHDLNHMLHTVTEDSRCRLCPAGWMWWRSHCFFFSVGLEENLKWNESAGFCHRHNSSLAVIRDPAEMEFIEGVMKTFPVFPFLWVGLTDSEQEGQWMWSDGTDIQHHMKLTVEWDADHRDCADLRGNRTLFASDCDTHGPWVCKKKS
ncbi:CD209 antigen-like protein C [Sphaeramia orbicularis]|uniref:CD209 antigen-like protein C n=1 Tax=Sphaeramia orbicularis TaxID=375764 RepID=UPI0011802807|nr:asialoglycoprotein receptor 2 [Sphaeramia orbicularis]